MKVTIKDIAAAVGVSPATVSLVLNDRPSRISSDTKERIKKTAEELGYAPNSAAVLLKTKRSYTLGLLIPEIRNDYYAKYAKGMEEACQAKGWTTFLCTTNNNPLKERQYIETLYAKNVDGISLVATPSNQSDLFMKNQELILSYGIPIVQMDMTDYREPGNAVMSDHFKGGYMATKHLISLGHSKIAFITGPSHLEGSVSRIHGCQQALSDAGLTWNPQLVFEGNYSYESGYTAIDNLISQEFTAVFAFNDLMAYGVYNSLEKYNLKIPDDISVVGYDDNFASSIINPPLTTVYQPIYEMGKAAADILIHAAEYPDAKPVVREFDLQLIVRKSTRDIHEDNEMSLSHP